MAEPAISITLKDMIRWVLDYQGKYDWVVDDAQVPDIFRAKSIINMAYRDFLNAKQWSFLTANASLTLPSDSTTYTVAAPDDFAGLVGKLTYATPQIRWRIEERSEVIIREYRSRSTNTVGIPYLYAVRPMQSTATPPLSEAFEFVFWPNPSMALVMNYAYRTTASPLVNLTDVPKGASQHSDTLQTLVLAKCELLIDKKYGALQQAAKDALAASIQRDADTVPASIGYNGDISDDKFNPPPGWGVDSYNGQPIDL